MIEGAGACHFKNGFQISYEMLFYSYAHIYWVSQGAPGVWFDVSWKRLLVHDPLLYFLSPHVSAWGFGIAQLRIGWGFAGHWLRGTKILGPADEQTTKFFERCTDLRSLQPLFAASSTGIGRSSASSRGCKMQRGAQRDNGAAPTRLGGGGGAVLSELSLRDNF